MPPAPSIRWAAGGHHPTGATELLLERGPAKVVLPSLESFEKKAQETKILPFPTAGNSAPEPVVAAQGLRRRMVSRSCRRPREPFALKVKFQRRATITPAMSIKRFNS